MLVWAKNSYPVLSRVATLSNEQEELDSVQEITRNQDFPWRGALSAHPPTALSALESRVATDLIRRDRLLCSNLLGNAGIEHARPVM